MLSALRKNPLLAALMAVAGLASSLPRSGTKLLNYLNDLAPAKSPTALTKRLQATGRTYDQWMHAMLTAPKSEIALHNSQVRRRNFRFATKKGLV